jgi:hypothetical protein
MESLRVVVAVRQHPARCEWVRFTDKIKSWHEMERLPIPLGQWPNGTGGSPVLPISISAFGFNEVAQREDCHRGRRNRAFLDDYIPRAHDNGWLCVRLASGWFYRPARDEELLAK